MRIFHLFGGAALLAAATPAAGPVAQVWSAADIRRVDTEITPLAAAKGLEGKTLGAYGSDSTAVWRRTKTGQAELHRTKTDLLIIEEGEATLLLGGTIPGGKSTSPVEIRGASIQGGESRKIGPGDVIRIPAGVPHQFVLSKGQAVTYFAAKISR